MSAAQAAEEEYYDEEGYGEEEGGEEYYEEEGGAAAEGDLEEIKRRVQEMEKETSALAEMQNQVESQIGSTEGSLDKNSV
jgi:hypothetical protein